MKKIVSLLTLSLLLLSGLSAKQRPMDEVLNLAKQKLNASQYTRTHQSQQLSVIPASQLLRTANTRSLTGEAFYFVSAPNGFVIISGDDRMRPVIGYSDAQPINTNNLPDNMLAWFEGYAAEYAYLQTRPDKGIPYSQPTTRSASGYPQSVAPLTQTIWGQDVPFNSMSPIKDGQHTKTGCVATAMAQVMAYHKHPQRGQGSYSYSRGGFDLSLDFSKDPFEWDKMQNSYHGSTDAEAKQAVAHLMYSCGVSIETLFGVTLSGATSISAQKALINYFDYDKNTVQFYRRNHFSYRAWLNMIKKEVSENRPIMYGGVSPTRMGHSFILDGYDKDDLVHTNWGWDWGGGYFAITTLNPFPGENDIEGFAIDQEMIVGIQKTTGNSIYQSSFVFTKPLRFSATQIGRNATFNILENIYSNHNHTELFSGVAQPILYRKDGEIQTLLGTPSAHNNIGSYGIRDLAFNNLTIPANVPVGEYDLHVGVKDNRETTWNKVRGEVADGSYYKVQVTNTQVNFTDATNFGGLRFGALQLLRDKVYIGMSLTFKLDFENTGDEWAGRVGVRMLAADGTITKEALVQERIYFYPGKQSVDLQTAYLDVPAGHYKFVATSSRDGVIWQPIVGAPEMPVEVLVEPIWTNFILSLAAPPIFKTELPANEMFELAVPVKNTGTGPYNGKVFFRVFVKDVGGLVLESHQEIMIEANDSKTVSFSVPHTLAQKTHAFRLFYNQSMMGDKAFNEIRYEFSVVAPSQMDKEFAISPSPIDEVLKVQTKALTYGYKIEPVDVTPQELPTSTAHANEYTIPVTNLPSGKYIIHIYRKEGQKEPKKLKFVKK